MKEDLLYIRELLHSDKSDAICRGIDLLKDNYLKVSFDKSFLKEVNEIKGDPLINEKKGSFYLKALEEQWNTTTAYLRELDREVYEIVMSLVTDSEISDIRKAYLKEMKYKKLHFIPRADIDMLMIDKYEDKMNR